MSDRKPRMHVKQRDDGEWYFTVIDTNGEPVGGSSGEGYTRRDDAVRGLHNLIAALAIAELVIDEPREGPEPC